MDGGERSAELWPRKQRWYGSLGIYYPGPGEHWKSNGGITRGVLEEGVLWFKTLDAALDWVKRSRSMGLAVVYTDDGLLIEFGKTPARKQINVNVWQIMIDGKKPRSLPGSQNDRITVVRLSGGAGKPLKRLTWGTPEHGHLAESKVLMRGSHL